MERKIYAIVMAAGRGQRFGGVVPKQFVEMAGLPVVVRAIATLRAWCPAINIVVALNRADLGRWSVIANRHGLADVMVTPGGSTRWESVKNAVDSLRLQRDDVVMVHDGARPLLTAAILDNLLHALCGHTGAIPVVPLTDSIRHLRADGSSEAVDRGDYRAVQTPQAFDGVKLQRAYALPYRPDFTDDASVMTAAGYTDIALVDGDVRNIKITNPQDVAIAEIYLKSFEKQ